MPTLASSYQLGNGLESRSGQKGSYLLPSTETTTKSAQITITTELKRILLFTSRHPMTHSECRFPLTGPTILVFFYFFIAIADQDYTGWLRRIELRKWNCSECCSGDVLVKSSSMNSDRRFGELWIRSVSNGDAQAGSVIYTLNSWVTWEVAFRRHFIKIHRARGQFPLILNRTPSLSWIWLDTFSP